MDKLLTNLCKKVYENLGVYHRERTYQNSLDLELSKIHNTIKEYPLKIMYDNQIVNTYYIDIVIPNISLPIEIKAIKNIGEADKNQIKNYMRHLNTKIGYLVNFGYTELNIIKFIGEQYEEVGLLIQNKK